jgi:CheY-like chemotaxis protein
MTSDKPILYAEDDEDDVFLMERAFRQAGIVNRLQIVPDGKLAIQYLSASGPYANRTEHPMPCLVLLDLKMPGKSGLDVLKWLRTQPATSTLPVLILTSSNQDGDIQYAYLLGANGYLIKPGKPDDLLAMVKSIRDYWLVQNRSPAAPVELPGQQKSAPTGTSPE